MAKLTLADIATGYGSETLYNSNNSLLEAALEKTLSRDGTTPNDMEADLDMNSNRILNLPEPVLDGEPATKAYADEAAGGLSTIPITVITGTTHTISDSDLNTWLQFTSSSAVTVTLNTGVGSSGKAILLEQKGTGQITISGSATVVAANGKKSLTRYSVVCLTCTASNTWNCFGDTTT